MSLQSKDRIQELEHQLGSARTECESLKTERDELQGELGRINGTVASQGQDLSVKEAKIRQLERRIGELTPQIEAKDGNIANLRTRIEELEEKVKALSNKDPLAIAQEQILADQQLAEAAARRKRAVEEADAQVAKDKLETTETAKKKGDRRIQTWGVALTGIGTLLIMAIIGLVKGTFPAVRLVIGITAIVAVVTLLSPYIRDVMIKIAPKAKENWRLIAHSLTGALGITFSSLGIITNDSSLVVFSVWLVDSVGFALILSLLVEMGYLAFIKYPIGDDRSNYGKAGMASVIVSLTVAAFYRPIGESWGLAPSFLVNAILGTIGLGLTAIPSVLSWHFAKLIKAWLGQFVDGVIGKGKKQSPWLIGAKLVLVFLSAFVGFLIGAQYAMNHGTTSIMAYVIGIGVGLAASAVYFIFEGMCLVIVFDTKYSVGRKLGAIIAAFAFASLTGYISFGWVYFTASEGSRFTETKDELVKSMQGYLQATEGSCESTANAMGSDPGANAYREPIVKMKKAVAAANFATTRQQLEVAHRDFMVVGPQASICLDRSVRDEAAKGQGPLSKVVLYGEPTPADLSAQYWWGKQIPGVKVQSGAGGQAIVAILIIDFLLPLLMLFAFFVYVRQKDTPEEVAVKNDGKIVSVEKDANGKVIAIHIDLGPESGCDVDDVLTVMDIEGKPLGAIKVVESMGNKASKCALVTRFKPEVGQLLGLLPQDDEPAPPLVIPPPPEPVA